MADLMSPVSGTGPTGPRADVAPPPRGGDADRVARRIEALTDSEGLFAWADRHEVETAANLLRGLDGPMRGAVLETLERRGTLGRFAAEVMDQSWVGPGLTVDDRRAMFADLARDLDGDGLARLSRAFAETDALSGGHAPVAEIGEAVATHASWQVKLDYVAALAPHATDRPSYDAVPGAFADEVIASDAEALAIAHVVGSLSNHPAAAETAFRSLAGTPGATGAVMDASVQKTFRFASGPGGAAASHHTADTHLYRRVMAAATAIPSDVALPADPQSAAALKAGVFAAAMDVHADVLSPTQARDRGVVLEGAQRLLSSDEDGLIAHMAANERFAGGSDLSRYAKAQIEAGRVDVLGAHFVELQLGDGRTGDARDRFALEASASATAHPDAVSRPLAEASGYFMGALYAASDSVTADQRERAEIATSFAKAGLTVLDKTVGGNTGIAASVGKEFVAYGLEALLVREDADRYDALYFSGFPRDAQGNYAIGSDARDSYRTTFDEVRTFANPG